MAKYIHKRYNLCVAFKNGDLYEQHYSKSNTAKSAALKYRELYGKDESLYCIYVIDTEASMLEPQCIFYECFD